MHRRHLDSAALLALLLISLSPGCYASHERRRPSTNASADPAYATAATPREEPSAPGCATSQWAPLAPAGLQLLRLPTINAIGGGFVASVVHRGSRDDFPTAVARMRSDLTGMLDAPRDAGVVTSQGAFVARPAMTVGGDGRLAACAVTPIGESPEDVPGGVAFFDAEGRLEQIVRLARDCSDVAWIDGRWVAIEVTLDAGREGPRTLVVLDDALAIARRIPLGYRGDSSSLSDRVIGLHGRAIVMGSSEDGPLLASVDLDTASVEHARFPFDPPIDLTASQFALLTHDEQLGVAWIASGGAWWATFDDALVSTADPIRLGDAEEYTSYVDAAPLDNGVIVAWAAGGIALALVGDDAEVTRADAELPASVTGDIETLEIAVQGDVVAVALQAVDPSAARSTVGVWSSRCRVR